MNHIFLPENLYSFSDTDLNQRRVDSFCLQIRDCRNSKELFLLSEKAHWLLCSFWHGSRDQFDYAQVMIQSELDFAQERF